MKILFENKRKLTEDVDSAKERIIDYVKSLSQYDMASVWNSYCDEAGYTDDKVYELDEYGINEIFQNPYDAFRAAVYGEVKPEHDFFKFNGYGNMESGYVEDLIYVDDLAEYCVDNDFDCEDSGIREILDEELNEEEEEEEEEL